MVTTVCGLAVGLGLPAASARGQEGAPDSEPRQIAVATAGDFRVAVTATPGTDPDMPTATARVTGYVRDGDTWRPVGRERLGDEQGWFWHTLTGAGAVCELAVGDEPDPHVTIRLLVSPSLGCGEPMRFGVEGDRLQAR